MNLYVWESDEWVLFALAPNRDMARELIKNDAEDSYLFAYELDNYEPVMWSFPTGYAIFLGPKGDD